MERSGRILVANAQEATRSAIRLFHKQYEWCLYKDEFGTSNSILKIVHVRQSAPLWITRFVAQISSELSSRRSLRLHITLQRDDTLMTIPKEQREALQDEIAALEKKLEHAKGQLSDLASDGASTAPAITLSTSPSLHTLLLLADSALPLGSFAFSSGLESFLAHKKLKGHGGQPSQVLFSKFLSLSLHSLASTALPYVLEAYRAPHKLDELDNDFDASTPCTVARRASVAQGRALLSVWERSFRSHYHGKRNGYDSASGRGDSTPSVVEASAMLQAFSTSLRASSDDNLPANAHLAPLWGVVTLLLRIDLKSSAYLFIFSHARTVISAAVRASVLGPYQAQAVLASTELQGQIDELVEKYWTRSTDDAGQSVPVVDLWVGRHEKLYSRIFNS